MKTSAFSQVGFLLIGGTLVLLIGALVKFDPEGAPPKSAAVELPAPAENADDSVDTSDDLPLPANFPTNLAQVVKLTRAGVQEDVALAYVQNSGEHYAPTADELIYLHESGVAEAVMAALVKPKHNKPSSPAMETSPEEVSSSPPREGVAEANSQEATAGLVAAVESPVAVMTRPPPGGAASYFYDDLAPYGDWVQTADSGWAWQPTVVQAVPNWQPYRDDGQWEYTDNGWYWQSSYPWGWAAFHYGGWWNDPSRGWLWQPGNRWAPAWVTWRRTPSHFGWAPLPPGVSLSVEFALLQDLHLSAAEADYGLTPSSYTFVLAAHFLSPHLAKYAAPVNKTATLLAASVSINHFSAASPKGRHPGVAPEEVAAATHTPVQPFTLNDVAAPTTRAPGISSRELAVYRPNPSAGRAETVSSKSNK